MSIHLLSTTVNISRYKVFTDLTEKKLKNRIYFVCSRLVRIMNHRRRVSRLDLAFIGGCRSKERNPVQRERKERGGSWGARPVLIIMHSVLQLSGSIAYALVRVGLWKMNNRIVRVEMERVRKNFDRKSSSFLSLVRFCVCLLRWFFQFFFLSFFFCVWIK